MATAPETSAAILTLSNQELMGLDIFERYDALESLGMLADEHRIGHPERPYEEWTSNDFRAVLAIFRTWPNDPALEEQLSLIKSNFARLYKDRVQEHPNSDRKDKMLLAADVLTTACKNVFGSNFPKIDLIFKYSPKPGYYGGLSPNDKLEINSANLSDEKVLESGFSGDNSFIELLAHESTHHIQRYLGSISDGSTLGAPLNMQVAEAFYESTAGARDYNRDLYWLHPFETQAREYAHALVAELNCHADPSAERPPPLRTTASTTAHSTKRL